MDLQSARRSWLLAAALASLAAARPAAAAVDPVVGLIAGTWRLAVPGTKCEETYVYRFDGTAESHSGAEHTKTRYRIEAAAKKGFYRLTDEVIESNGRPDCSGSRTAVGAKATWYAAFVSPGDRMFLCAAPALSRCMGPLRRVDSRDVI
jgi:hypothetical protein